ncbi:hypothetical protein [Chryseobacterium indologenes]|uniref:hypothetical protein n=1 Tax=Chryseobacterium indologenes TaxID=253 RepID=UPI00301AF2C9
MKEFFLTLLLIAIKSCNQKLQLKESTNTHAVQIDYKNIEKAIFFKNHSNTNTTYCIKGYDFYQSRYMIPFDEKNSEILELYKKNNFKEITTIFSFSNLKKDTIYSFPLTDSEKFPIFGKRYENTKNGHIDDSIKVYFKVYSSEKSGKIAIIDSIR